MSPSSKRWLIAVYALGLFLEGICMRSRDLALPRSLEQYSYLGFRPPARPWKRLWQKQTSQRGQVWLLPLWFCWEHRSSPQTPANKVKMSLDCLSRGVNKGRKQHADSGYGLDFDLLSYCQVCIIWTHTYMVAWLEISRKKTLQDTELSWSTQISSNIRDQNREPLLEMANKSVICLISGLTSAEMPGVTHPKLDGRPMRTPCKLKLVFTLTAHCMGLSSAPTDVVFAGLFRTILSNRTRSSAVRAMLPAIFKAKFKLTSL